MGIPLTKKGLKRVGIDYIIVLQWNLSMTVTYGPNISVCNREVAAL